jgi:hypothetical protein
VPANLISYALPTGSDGPPPPVDPSAAGADASAGEDFPYKVEVWDVSKRVVEQVLAVTVSSSIGYAAYYAATREHPSRYVTLRHRGAILIRWNGPIN